MPLVVLELPRVTGPVAVRVRALAVHAALAEGAVELGPVGEEDAGQAVELVVDEGALEPVAVAVQHAAPAVHAIVDPPPHQPLVQAGHEGHGPRAVLLVLLPFPAEGVARGPEQHPDPVPTVLLPLSLAPGGDSALTTFALPARYCFPYNLYRVSNNNVQSKREKRAGKQ